MTSRRIALLSVAASVTLIAFPALYASTAQAAGPVDCGSFSSNVTQVVKPTSGSNLLSRSAAEIESAQSRYGYTEDHGVIAKVADRPGAGLTPVWRLYRSGDFVWATDGIDANRFAANGYSKQFIEFYAGTSPANCLGAVKRLQRNGVHRVANPSEVAALVGDGWVDDGITFYAVVEAPTTAPRPPAAGDSRFSIAAIPDTQNEVSSPSGTRFSNRVSWLLQNRTSLDLRYAMQVGDLSSWGNVDPAQFAKASNEIKPFEAVLPWAVAAGNHDTAAVCSGGSACPGANASVTVRDVSTFDRYFPPSRFGNMRGTYEPGHSENSWATFSAGNRQWMVLTLELWARPAVINWAKQIVSANPDRNVIVLTHSYLEADGTISSSNGGYGATSPQYLFENLIKVYPNIKMVLSGHVGQGATRTDTGTAGNKVVSFLQAYHSPTNPVRIIEIDTAAGTVTSRVYAPGTNTDYPQDTTSTGGMSFG